MLASTTITPLQFQAPPPNTSLLCIHNRHYNLAVRANAYTRVPLETAGAYRLIDEKTGESFIVWGAEDDEVHNDVNPPVPPPPPPPPAGDSIAETAPRRNRSDVRAGGGRNSAAIGSFGKLKAQRVRALIRSTSAKRSHHLSSVGGEKDAASPQLLEEDEDVVADEDGTDVGTGDSNFVRAIEKGGSLRSKTAASTIAAGGRPSRGWGSAPPPFDAGVRGRFNRKQQQQKRKNKATDGGFFSRKSFKELGFSDDMIEALRSQRFVRPSHIQAMSYLPVLQGKSCIIADQSGSGKTLAYLGPVIQSLRQEELQGLGKSYPKNPRLVVLVPTAELASQVLSNCRSISKYGVPFRSMVATGGFRQKTQLESLQQELDVLIATPGRFIYLRKEGFLELSNLKSVVLDEVDILFGDEDFEEVLKSLIDSAPVTTQYLFVTATLPVDIYNKLVEIFPDCEVIMGPGMHRTSSGLEEILVDCSGEGDEKTPETAFLNKKAALLRLVEESLVPKTIIFCNKIETCRKIENILKRTDRKGRQIRVLPFHSAIEQETRLAHMKEFLDPKSNESLFLICTDRASRGIDFTNVDHVVLFDFPRDPSEYVRRVGRTARGAGGKGRAFVFAVGKQVSLAHKIIQRNEKGHPLHDVPSAYELQSSIF